MSVGGRHAPHLLVDPALQLHDLVLHAHVELLEVLHRAGLGPQPLQLPPGPQAPHAALQKDHGRQETLVAFPGQPAPHPALDHHRLLLVKQLRKQGGDTESLWSWVAKCRYCFSVYFC